MKLVVWMVFGVIALVWTGGAWLAAELTQWAGQALASGEAASLGREFAQWPVPQWLSLWVDPGLIQGLQSTVLWAVDTVHDALPMLGSAVGWLVPMVWGLWALGLLVLLVLTIAAHVLLTRMRPAQARRA